MQIFQFNFYQILFETKSKAIKIKHVLPYFIILSSISVYLRIFLRVLFGPEQPPPRLIFFRKNVSSTPTPKLL